MITLLVAMLMTVTAGAVLLSDGSDAEPNVTHSLTGDETSVMPEDELTFTIMFNEAAEYDSLELSYKAKLTNSSGTTQSNAVTPDHDNSYDNGSEVELTVKAPKSSGDYTLTVTWTEEIKEKGASEKTTQTIVDTKGITVIEPVKLSATVENNGSIDVDATVYFFVDGKRVENSDTDLSVVAGKSATITYDFNATGLSHGKHTFYVENNDGSVHAGDGTFYYKQGSLDYMIYIMAIVLIIIVIAFVYVLRKPVKNYGKPKARR